MVLLGTYNLRSRRGRKGLVKVRKVQTSDAFIKLSSEKIDFNLCKECEVNNMASIPPSTFSAGRIRETQRSGDMKLSKINKNSDSSKFFNTEFKELSPLKYNSKLMNSIWGFYNRYSPHNVKKVNDAYVFNGDLQQSAANSNKNEPMISLSSAKLDNVWAAMSQSH